LITGKLLLLRAAVRQLAQREGRYERCMQAPPIEQPKAVLWQQIRAVARAAARM